MDLEGLWTTALRERGFTGFRLDLIGKMGIWESEFWCNGCFRVLDMDGE